MQIIIIHPRSWSAKLQLFGEVGVVCLLELPICCFLLSNKTNNPFCCCCLLLYLHYSSVSTVVWLSPLKRNVTTSCCFILLFSTAFVWSIALSLSLSLWLCEVVPLASHLLNPKAKQIWRCERNWFNNHLKMAAFDGFVFHLHGISAQKKKEVVPLIEANGGTVTYIFGKNVC